MTAVSSICVISGTCWYPSRGLGKLSVSKFVCFCLPLLLQPMAAEGVRLSLNLNSCNDTGACMSAP